jgi:7,8-dihydropterin-6-yl-methyl-4-(beta-D-ribofuranosyl)aminobenzene 5'-phosphate synthase
MRPIKILSFLFVLISLQSECQNFKYLDSGEGITGITATNGIDKPVTVKVIYDNYVRIAGFKADWGYSVEIEGLDKNVLFDTGANPEIFASNFKAMNLDAGKIDILVLSHEHGDHTGGIPAFIKMRSNIPVIIPYSFSDSFKNKMLSYGLEPMLVRKPARICENLYTSGEFDYKIPEQALVLNTRKGLVVMTGCSHPGIIEMLEKIRLTFNKDIYMVFGGFHTLESTEKEMNSIIARMKAIGVVKCGATHCTGDKQIEMIKKSFGEDYMEMGAGNILVIEP